MELIKFTNMANIGNITRALLLGIIFGVLIGQYSGQEGGQYSGQYSGQLISYSVLTCWATYIAISWAGMLGKKVNKSVEKVKQVEKVEKGR